MTDVTIAEPKKRKPGTFGPDRPPPNRTGPNKTTRILKEALLIAAEMHGYNGNGSGKLVGFLRKVAEEDLRAFCMLLGRIIPLQVENRTIDDEKKSKVYRSVEEVKRDLASRGIDMEIMMKFARIVDEDDEDDDGSLSPRQNGVPSA